MPRQTISEVPVAGVSPRPHRPLRALLLAQFLGAFNDNVYKMVVAMLAVHEACWALFWPSVSGLAA